MKKITILLLTMLSLFSQNSEVDFQNYLTKTYKKFNVQQLSADSLKNFQNPIILDTREKNEYDVSHLKNARFLSYDDFDIDDWTNIPKDSTLVLYCSVGYRSCKIAEAFIEAGYKKVYNLYGGIFHWVNSDKDIVNSKNEKTNQVHSYNRHWGRFVLNKKFQKVTD